MAVETLAFTYTSEDEIERLFSIEGVDLRSDDLPEDDVGVTQRSEMFTEVIADATDEVNMYALEHYKAEDMADNRWVRRRATYFAACFLGERRGNGVPKSIGNRCERFTEELVKVKAGKIDIPRLGKKSNDVPTVSNLTIDDRHHRNKIRVQPSISTGGTYPEQDVERDLTFGD